MKKILTPTLAALFAFVLIFQNDISAQKRNPWQDASERSFAKSTDERRIIPDQYRTLSLDLKALKKTLSEAPMRFGEATRSARPVLPIPLPDGTFGNFEIVEAPIMHPDLAARYPEIKSYAGWSADDPTAYLRFGVTQKGFHAVLFSSRHSSVFIDAYAVGDVEHYVSYFKKDYSAAQMFECGVEAPVKSTAHASGPMVTRMAGDCEMRQYRLALACTGEYAQFHGGTVGAVMAEYNVAMTRVNGIYEIDFGVTMQLVPNTDELIFLNAGSDPYTNNDGGTMLGQNQTTVNNTIGSGNYDIGHVFSTGGGGIAGLGVVCFNSQKARGVTGLGSPVNDPFYVDYVAHEMGHQFGGNHTQNNACNRNGATAMEPGSASTIMGYAGICAPNVQNASDDYFHAISIDEISAHITGTSCAAILASSNEAPSVSTGGAFFNVPKSTPFALTAEASDPDGDGLTYCWEQMDNQVADMPPNSTNTGGPAFRTFDPSESPTRYFPNLSAIIGNTAPMWEVLPSVGRNMNFRCTVRDGLCTDETDVTLSVSGSAGPFLVESPNTSAVVWTGLATETVTWDVANTDAAPVNTSTVDIFLSEDGGNTYPYLLAEEVPNDGSHPVEVPNVETNMARVMVKGHGNVFFDISNQNFTIEAPSVPTFTMSVSPGALGACPDGEATFSLDLLSFVGFDEAVSFEVAGLPTGATASFSANPVTPSNMVTLTVGSLQSAVTGPYPLTISATGGGISQEVQATLFVLGEISQVVDSPTPADGETGTGFAAAELSWPPVLFAETYMVEIADSPSFQNILADATTSEPSFSFAGAVAETVYYWRVKAANQCSEGDVSGTFAFQTGNLACGQYESTDVPVAIDVNNVGEYTSTLEIGGDDVISSFYIYTEFDHTYVGDLAASVTSPNGTTVQLFDQPGVPASNFGCAGDDIEVGFSDEAANTAADFEAACGPTPAISGDYQAIGSLSSFLGENSGGTWTLNFSDNFAEDGGALAMWYIGICSASPLLPANLLTNNILQVPQGQSGDISQFFLETQGAPTSINYILLSVPENGNLQLGGTPLVLGDGFTQADINSGLLQYIHDGSMTTTDEFLFDVAAEANWLHSQLFQIQIIENNLSASAVLTQGLDCHDNTDGIITVMASGGSEPLGYSLNGGATQVSNIFGGLSAGEYTVTVQDGDGFTIMTNMVEIVNPPALTLSANVMDNDLTANGDGGTGSLEYSLNGTDYQPGNVFMDLPNGSYTVYVRDENGCVQTTTAVVAVNTIIVSLALTEDVSCFGEDNGVVTATAGGGSQPYQYSLNGGPFQMSNVFDGLAPGEYTVEVMDADGFTQSSGTVMVSNPPALTLSVDVMGNDLTANGSGGTGSLEYSPNGMNYQPGNLFVDLPNGSYTIYVRDENGCVESATVIVSVNEIVVSLLLIEDVSCFGEDDGVVTASAGGGSQPYQYSLNGGPFQMSNVFDGLAPGEYTVEVMDADGFSQMGNTVTVSQPALLAAGAMVAGNTITVDADGGTSPYQYSLNGGPFQMSNVFDDLPNGDYSIVVLDANECEATATATVTVNNLSVTVSVVEEVSCAGAADGLVEVNVSGGSGPFSYSLNGGASQPSNVFDNVPGGQNEILVTDGDGLTQTVSFTVGEPSAISGSANASGYTVSVSASGGTGGLSYSLDGGPFQPGDEFFPVASGDHTVTVLDENECEASFQVGVDVPVLEGALMMESDLGCHDSTNGSITVSANGGVGPYEYSLNGGPFQMSNTFVGLGAGFYEITIRDSGGFEASPNGVSITAPVAITATSAVSGNDVTINANGGTGALSYSLDGGAFQSSNIFMDVADGTHVVTIVDENGCEEEIMVFVNTAPLLISASVAQGVSCPGEADAIITISASGGQPPLMYSLNGVDFQVGNVFTGLAAGQYSPTVMDGTGSVLTSPAITIADPAPIVATGSAFGPEITVEAEGGTGDYQYSFDGGPFQMENVFEVIWNGTYTVAVMDENGCTTEVDVVVNKPEEVLFDVTHASCSDAADGIVIIEGVNGGYPPYMFSLNGGPFSSQTTWEGFTIGENIFFVMDATGYEWAAHPILIDAPTPIAIEPELNGNTLVLNTTGGAGSLQYSIDGGATFQDENIFENLPNGTYEVVVMDENGCLAETTVTVNFNSVAEADGGLHFEVLPNPSAGLFILKIEGAGPANGLEYTVHDVAGRVVMQSLFAEGGGNVQTLDLQDFANGTYQLRLTDGKLWGVKRLVVLR